MKLDHESDSAIKGLAQHVLYCCLEGPDEYHDYTPDEVELAYDEWTVTEVDTDGSVIEVQAEQDGHETTLATRRTRHHPAEYEHHDGTAIALARADFSERPLAGETFLEIDWVGGKPTPPDPEPYDL